MVRGLVGPVIDFGIPTGTAMAGAALSMSELSAGWPRTCVIGGLILIAAAFMVCNSVFRHRRNASARRAGAVTAVVALIGVGVSAAALAGGPVRTADGPDVRIAAEVAGHASQVLSYQMASVESDVAQGKKLLTGGFLEYFSSYAESTLIPQARQQALSVRWEVRAASLSSVDGNEAVVLAFLDGEITRGDQPGSEPMSSSVRLSAQRVESTWLISDLVPI
jgi:Mce-associated membrane protein